MHQNIYNLYSQKSPTCFDLSGPSSGRIVLIHYCCVYTVKCECALGFILRLRGIVHCPRSVDRTWNTLNLRSNVYVNFCMNKKQGLEIACARS
jgi:hypothetical protein